jgi:hypothetical protein
MATIARAFAKKDTWITEQSVTSNFGASPILEVWTKFNSTLTDPVKQRSRILIQCDLSALSSSIVSLAKYPDPRTDSTVSAFLCIKNARHGGVQAENFTLDVFPLTASWSEGQGIDNDNFSQTGYANAISASNTNSWNYDRGGTGGDVYIGWDNRVYDSNSASQYFETGQEDLKVDITNYFKAYLNYATGTSVAAGGSADYGFLVRMSDAQECRTAGEATSAGVATATVSSSFYSKKFYSRQTNTRKMPYIQMEWPGEIKDNRSSIVFGKTASLYYYSLINSELTDLNGTGPFPGYVNLSGNGTSLAAAVGGNLTASRISKGVYKLAIGTATNGGAGSSPLTAINIAASSSTAFVDTWVVTTAGEQLSNSFTFDCTLPISGSQDFKTANYEVSLANLNSRYEKGSLQRIRVFVRDKTTQWQAVTGTTTAMKNSVIQNGTVEIRELVTNDVEVPAFGLSFDKDGNYFDLDSSLLYNGMQYKPVLKLNAKGEILHFDRPEDWKFQIGDIYDINYKSGY